jgi:hypothetical protein
VVLGLIMELVPSSASTGTHAATVTLLLLLLLKLRFVCSILLMGLVLMILRVRPFTNPLHHHHSTAVATS